MEVLTVAIVATVLLLIGTVSLQQKRKRNDAFAAHRAALLEVTGGVDYEQLSQQEEKQVDALAVQKFKAMGHDDDGKHACEFVPFWGKRIAETGSYEDEPRSGRPSRLTEEDAEICLNVLREGYISSETNRQEWFHGIGHAKRVSAEFAEIQTRCGFSDKVLLQRLKQMCETLKFKKLRVRKLLTDVQKMERMQCAAMLLSIPKKKLTQEYFFVDHKRLLISPQKNEGVLVDTDFVPQGEYVEDPRVWTGKKQDSMRLSFYAMVNGVLGPVSLAFVLGTTGQDASDEMVSAFKNCRDDLGCISVFCV
jgi:transposase